MNEALIFFEIVSPRIQHLFQWIFYCSKHFWNLWYSGKPHCRISFHIIYVLKSYPFRLIFSLGNKKKSHEARIWEV